ncbi:MAG: MFS transporter [Deltaproteobacteria bacterium]|nr:MFS transporter [Deltaproteobacteria bacterium]MCW5801687.1 MFS transporter [Deltaproteobacteria bacterium]
MLDRALRPLSRVRPGEGTLAALMMLGVFLLLTCHYLLKTAREGLILSGGAFGLRGDELKTYATGGMAILLLAIIPGYGWVASRVRRLVLIEATCGFTLACLLGFYVLGRAGVPVGLAFFVWLGISSLFVVAQFWSYANDIYTEEQGKRLFGIIAIGASLGAIVGPQLAGAVESFLLMPVAGAILVAYAVLLHVIDRRHTPRAARREAEAPIGGEGVLRLVMRDRYLLLIAALLIVVNVVNTTGEFILSKVVRDHAIAAVPDGLSAQALEAARREYIKDFYSSFYAWVNAAAFALQAFAVSRVIDRLGVRRALFLLPVLVFGTYGLIAAAGGLALIRAAKITENGTNYSLQNTLQQTLFLTMSRPAKYKAKAAIDTFAVRAGDLCAAAIVALGLHAFGLGYRALAIVSVVVVVAVWLPVCIALARQHGRTTEAAEVPG